MNESRGHRYAETSYQNRASEVNASRRMEGTAAQEREPEAERLRQQSVAETAHSETKANILDVYEKSIQESRKKELSSAATNERLNVLSVEDYSERFPQNSPLVMGHCDAEGNIYIKAVSDNAVSHISTHETVHLCSNRESGLNENGNWSIKSGLRETEFAPNRALISDTGRGVNEGATELYTLRELNRRGDTEAAQAMEAYPQSREWAERLEQIVGEDRLADAYFGGQVEAMKREFNRYDGEQEKAWETFSKNVDIVEYGTDAQEVQQAQRELAEQYFRMILEKDLRGEQLE